MMKIVFLFCWIVLCQATENVHNKMYVQLAETIPCILRLNGSKSFGCTSKRDGNVGVIHLAYKNSDLSWVIDTPKDDSYVVVLNVEMFTMTNLKKLNASSNVNGVLLVLKEQRSEISKFSPESKCPNRYSGLADAAHNYTSDICPASGWNPYGSEIAMQFWNIPIFFTDDESTILNIEEWFKKYNLPLSGQGDRPLSALELSSFMFSSGDSNKCIRRSSSRYDLNPLVLCDPLGDENIYAPVIPFNEFNKTKNKSPYIFVTARLDSSSLFFGRAVGAQSTATSLVALLLTSKLLTRLVADNKSSAEKNVLFLLFNGEAYDYIGSQRVVYDMLHGDFPFKEAPLELDDIGLFIELSQLRHGDVLTYHTYKNLSRDNVPLIREFDTLFKLKSDYFNYRSTLNQLRTDKSYPPSSHQSFLAQKAVPGFVLATYRENFQNRFYHSIFDDAQNLDYKFANGSGIQNDGLAAFIANFSTVLAHTLFSQMTKNEYTENITITREEADEVLCCFIETTGCEFFSRFEGPRPDGLPLDYFISINRVTSMMTAFTKNSLKYMMGHNVSAGNQNECLYKGKNYLWVQSESRCLESFVNSSTALSPAFLIPEYELNEGIYSSWTESAWSSTEVRMFRKPSAKYEWLVCSIGSTILVASFLALFWVRRNSRDLFNFPHLIATSSI